MKKIQTILKAPKALLGMALLGLLLTGCNEDNPSLGSLPSADFTTNASPSNPNSINLKNTSTSVGVAYWEVPALNLGSSDLHGDNVTVNFTFAGTYQVKMMLAAQGGITTVTKTVTIAQNDPNACNGTVIGFLTGCGTKTWKLNPAPNAMWVSQWAGGDGSWWANGAQEVIDRPCMFNDEYKFTFNAGGDFVFDDKGDFYSDGYLGNSPGWTCQPSSNYTAAQAPWGSGNFNFIVIPTGGHYGLGQIKLLGLGAHIGIQKAINDNETPNGATATSITYDVKSMQHVTDPAGDYDLLTVTMHYGSWSSTEGWWTFTLRSY
ncbi:MAG: hypothetical protein RL607_42 [Bacteroidota bacterium]|jgi:hypothetical protein